MYTTCILLFFFFFFLFAIYRLGMSTHEQTWKAKSMLSFHLPDLVADEGVVPLADSTSGDPGVKQSDLVLPDRRPTELSPADVQLAEGERKRPSCGAFGRLVGTSGLESDHPPSGALDWRAAQSISRKGKSVLQV